MFAQGAGHGSGKGADSTHSKLSKVYGTLDGECGDRTAL